MYNRIKGYSSIVITLIMIFSVVMTPNISNARDPIIIINAQNDGWNDTFENMSYVSAYSNVTIMNNDVILNVNSPFVPSSWAKQGLAFPLSGFQEDWINMGHSVIKDDGIYKMWYAGQSGGSYRLFHATSTDGISWAKQGKIMDLGTSGGTEDLHLGHTYVIKEDGIYKMWYGGHDGSTWTIHYATSIDGISWTRFGQIMDVSSAGQLDDTHVVSNSIMKMPDGTYKMWYGGYSDASTSRIMLATSPDGIAWTKAGLCLDLGASGAIDDAGVSNPDVTMINGIYYMFFGGSDGSLSEIHYATSIDGENWTKHGLSLPKSVSGLDDKAITGPRLLIDTDGYAKIWYAGGYTAQSNYRIFWAQIPITYFDNGNLTSEYIELPAGKAWSSLNITKSEPSAAINITVTILDNSTGSPIPGYVNMTGIDIDISGISPAAYSSIKLFSIFSGSGSASPELHEWEIKFNDIVPGTPISSIDVITPYGHSLSPLGLTATAIYSEYVEFWYRHAPDNSTWGAWSLYSNDTSAASWTSSFSMPDGEGFYEFYSRAGNLTSIEYEPAPLGADALVIYDTMAPLSSVDTIAPYWHKTNSLTITATANDLLSGIASVELWYSFEGGGYSNFGTDTIAPYSWNFNWPDGVGDYSFYSRSTDNVGNYETVPSPSDAASGYDNIDPVSSLDTGSANWRSTGSIVVSSIANDDLSGLAEVELYYRYAADNASWSDWLSWADASNPDTNAPYNWSFDLPNGVGYYQLYSVASDVVGNNESAPAIADIICAYFTPLDIYDLTPGSPTTGDDFTISSIVAGVIDVEVVHINYRFEYVIGLSDWYNVSMNEIGVDNFNYAISVPVNATGLNYIIMASDIFGYWNSTTIIDLAVVDNDDPAANAGLVQLAQSGTLIIFDASNSTDNIGIINYTWSFFFGGESILLYGMAPSFNFTEVGNYTIVLTVADDAGNSGTDSILILVSAPPPDNDDDGIPDAEDPDDDNDGYLDEWEVFLDTDPNDPTDAPIDTDNDGRPDGDATNSESWMDIDDDGDDVTDDDDPEPLDSNVTSTGGVSSFWWIIILILIAAIFLAIILLSRKKEDLPPQGQYPPPPPPQQQFAPPIQSQPITPQIEQVPPPPPPPIISPENQELLNKLEQRYSEGSISEETYLKLKDKYNKEG